MSAAQAQAQGSLVVVARAGEIPPGGRKIVVINGRSVGVFNVKGSYFALRNTCPHAGGPLCEGPISGLVVAREPGDYEYLRRGEFLRCPWHGWEFDIRTGQSWVDPVRNRVRRYEVREERGSRLLEMDEAERPLAEVGLVRGPYQAEVYTVRPDGQYIVMEL